LPTEAHRLITCFLPSGRAAEVLERMRKEHGLASAAYHHARGVGTGTRTGRGAFFSAEREVLTVLVPESRADELFRELYFAAGLNAPNNGIIFMERLLRATPTVMPEAPKSPA
jgi:hypothetical protein